jgi:hypothetical protein
MNAFLIFITTYSFIYWLVVVTHCTRKINKKPVIEVDTNVYDDAIIIGSYL